MNMKFYFRNKNIKDLARSFSQIIHPSEMKLMFVYLVSSIHQILGRMKINGKLFERVLEIAPERWKKKRNYGNQKELVH
jgi:hypothetical protein